MSDIAIQVDKLGKCFEIGELVTFKKAMRKLARPLGLAHKIEPNLFWALKDVSFDLKRGEVLGVIGRNGAGKSTLLKLLSRITAPSAGKAVINGRVGSLLEVGTGFHPELTGRENVYLNGAILGMKKREIDAKFDEIVAFAETEKFIDTPVKRYSSGMRVRLAFAVAAHLEPEILICDEVLAVGDAAFQAKCLGKMGDVAKEGRTVLLVSHNMASISNLCETAILLNDGQISFHGDASSAIEKYLNPEDTATKSSIDLDRFRTKESTRIITSVITRNKVNASIFEVKSGDFLQLVVAYETSHELHNCEFGVGVDSVTQGRVATLTTPMQYGLVGRIRKKGIFSLSIDKLPLAPGKYVLTIDVKISRSIFDRLERAIPLEVIPGDFFGTGKYPSCTQGLFLIRGKWDFDL